MCGAFNCSLYVSTDFVFRNAEHLAHLIYSYSLLCIASKCSYIWTWIVVLLVPLIKHGVFLNRNVVSTPKCQILVITERD